MKSFSLESQGSKPPDNDSNIQYKAIPKEFYDVPLKDIPLPYLLSEKKVNYPSKSMVSFRVIALDSQQWTTLQMESLMSGSAIFGTLSKKFTGKIINIYLKHKSLITRVDIKKKDSLYQLQQDMKIFYTIYKTTEASSLVFNLSLEQDGKTIKSTLKMDVTLPYSVSEIKSHIKDHLKLGEDRDKYCVQLFHEVQEIQSLDIRKNESPYNCKIYNPHETPKQKENVQKEDPDFKQCYNEIITSIYHNFKYQTIFDSIIHPENYSQKAGSFEPEKKDRFQREYLIPHLVNDPLKQESIQSLNQAINNYFGELSQRLVGLNDPREKLKFALYLMNNEQNSK